MWSTWLLLAACSSGPTAPPASDVAPTPGAAAPKLQLGSTTGPAPVPAEPDNAVIKRADCDAVEPGEPPQDGCFSGTLSCGDEVVGHTLGGGNHFDTRFYEQYFCTPATTNHDGGDERVYRLQMPDGLWQVEVTLDSPCADVDLAAFPWDDESCPDKTARIDQCEMNRQSGTKRERVQFVSQSAGAWLLVVEGEGEHEGAFGLRVTCQPVR